MPVRGAVGVTCGGERWKSPATLIIVPRVSFCRGIPDRDAADAGRTGDGTGLLYGQYKPNAERPPPLPFSLHFYSSLFTRKRRGTACPTLYLELYALP